MTRKIKIHEEDAKSLLIIAFTDSLETADGLSVYRDFITDMFDSIYPQLSQGLQEFTVDTLQSRLRGYFGEKEIEDKHPSSTKYWRHFYERLEKLKQEIPYNNPDQARN